MKCEICGKEIMFYQEVAGWEEFATDADGFLAKPTGDWPKIDIYDTELECECNICPYEYDGERVVLKKTKCDTKEDQERERSIR